MRLRESVLPLAQHVKGRQGEREAGVEILLDTRHDLLEVTDARQP